MPPLARYLQLHGQRTAASQTLRRGHQRTDERRRPPFGERIHHGQRQNADAARGVQSFAVDDEQAADPHGSRSACELGVKLRFHLARAVAVEIEGVLRLPARASERRKHTRSQIRAVAGHVIVGAFQHERSGGVG